MEFKEYQEESHKTAIYPREGMAGIMYPVLGLMSEAGELAGKVKKWIRDGYSYEELREAVQLELGDNLWYISEIATAFELDLSDVAQANIDKLQDRQERNVLKGSGDYR